MRVFGEYKEKIGECSGGRVKGGRPKMVWLVCGESKEKIDECSGGRANGGRARQLTVLQVFGKSKEKNGKCSGRSAKGGRASKSLVSRRRRLANVLAGEPRVADRRRFG